MSSIDSDIASAFAPAAPPPQAANVDDDIASAFTTAGAPSGPYDPDRPTIGGGLEDQLHGAASGFYHGVLAGYKGLFTLATTRDIDAASEAVRAEQAKTFKPSEPAISDVVRKNLQMQTLSPTALGDWASEHGASPGLSTALAAAPTAVSAALSLRRPPAEPALSAESTVDAAAARQSGGAAGASVDIRALSPETKAAVAAAGPNLNIDVLNRHLEAESLPIPMRLSEGEATGDPGIITNERNMRQKVPEIANHINENNQKLIDNLDEIRREASPGAVSNDSTVNGQQLIDKEKAYLQPKYDAVNQAYEKLTDANGGKFPVDGKALAENVTASLDKNLKSGYAPQLERQISQFADGTRQMTFADWENLRTDASVIMRGNDPLAKQAAYVVRQELERLPMTGDVATTLKPLADNARGLSNSLHQEIDADPALSAIDNDPAKAGEPSALADNYIQKYLINGKKANLQRMQQRYADDPEAQEVIKTAPLNYLKKRAGIDAYTNTGTFSQAGYNRALAELRPNMDVLLDADTAAKTQQLGNVSRYTQQRPAGSSVNESNTYTSQLAGAAREGLEGLANIKTGGMYGAIRRLMPDRSNQLIAQKALSPGAGLTYRSPTTPRIAGSP